MKKIIKLLLIICVISIFNNVKAANYELKELIPINTETAIVTNHFSYQSFSYKSKDIFFINFFHVWTINFKNMCFRN